MAWCAVAHSPTLSLIELGDQLGNDVMVTITATSGGWRLAWSSVGGRCARWEACATRRAVNRNEQEKPLAGQLLVESAALKTTCERVAAFPATLYF